MICHFLGHKAPIAPMEIEAIKCVRCGALIRHSRSGWIDANDEIEHIDMLERIDMAGSGAVLLGVITAIAIVVIVWVSL